MSHHSVSPDYSNVRMNFSSLQCSSMRPPLRPCFIQPYRMPRRFPYSKRFVPPERFLHSRNSYPSCVRHSPTITVIGNVINNYQMYESNKNFVNINTNDASSTQQNSPPTDILPRKAGKRRKNVAEKQSIGINRPWNAEDAQRALNTERRYSLEKNGKCIRITFPDEEINCSIVRTFHENIKSVQFRTPCTPRHCLALLDEGADVTKTIEALNRVPFQNSFLKAELVVLDITSKELIEDIDPYQLYIGNLPITVTTQAIKDLFSKAKRVSVGFAYKCGPTRYAFVRFGNVEDAIESYILNANLSFDNKSAVIRFRRIRGSAKPQGVVSKEETDIMQEIHSKRQEILVETKVMQEMQSKSQGTVVESAGIQDNLKQEVSEESEIQKDLKQDLLDKLFDDNEYPMSDEDAVNDDESEEYPAIDDSKSDLPDDAMSQSDFESYLRYNDFVCKEGDEFDPADE